MKLAVLGVGMGCYYAVPNYLWLVIASVVWSQGLHVWMPLPHSMTMALAEPGTVGRRLGQIRGAGAVGLTYAMLESSKIGRVVTMEEIMKDEVSVYQDDINRMIGLAD